MLYIVVLFSLRCGRVGYSSEVLLGAEISSATNTLDNHVGISSHIEKKLKETPI